MPTLKDPEFAAGAPESPATRTGGLTWTLLALVVAVLALWGSLYLSLGMGLKACPLCLYQRTFVMGALGVLGIGWLAGAGRSGILGLLALPCAVGGLGVAVFHEYLEQIGKLECPAGILGLGTAPQQSLAVLLLLSVILAWPSFFRGPNGRVNWARRIDAALLKAASTFSALILGGVFALAAVKSAPPPVIPKEPYKLPVNEDGCRPPYHPQQ
jgi:disulfide bond formation protein DsbB